LNTNNSDILTKVMTIVVSLVKEDTIITEDTALQAEIGMTSLQVMEMILEVEDEFDISFPLNRLPEIKSAADLAREVAAVLEQ